MIKVKRLTLFWLILGLIFSLLVVVTVFTGLSGKVYIADPEGIHETAETLLQAVRTGDWEILDETILGQPSLVPATGEAESAQRILYEAYQNSLQWTIPYEFQIQGPYAILKITISCLDIMQVTREMAGIPKDNSSAVDLQSAVETVLNTRPQTVQHELTLTFRREDHQWRVVPNSALQTLLSGFITK